MTDMDMADKKHIIWTKDFVLICLINFFVGITLYGMIVTLPLYVVDRLHLPEIQAGMVFSAFLVGSVIFRPVSGLLIDKYDNKTVLVTAVILYGVLSVGYLFVRDFIVLLVLRFFHGFLNALLSTALLTSVNTLIPMDRKGEGVGYYIMFLNLSWIVTSLIGIPIVLYFDFSTLFIVNLCILAAAVLCGFAIELPKGTAAPARERLSWTQIIEPRVAPLSGIGGLTAFAYVGILSFFSLYAADMGRGEIASIFFLLFGGAMIASRPLAGRSQDRYGADRVVYPSMALFLLGLLLLALVPSVPALLIAAVIIGIGYGSLFSVYQAVVFTLVPDNRGGVAISTFYLFYDIFLGIGSTVLGAVVHGTSYRTMYGITAAITGAALILYHLLSRYKSTSAVRP